MPRTKLFNISFLQSFCFLFLMASVLVSFVEYLMDEKLFYRIKFPFLSVILFFDELKSWCSICQPNLSRVILINLMMVFFSHSSLLIFFLSFHWDISWIFEFLLLIYLQFIHLNSTYRSNLFLLWNDINCHLTILCCKFQVRLILFGSKELLIYQIVLHRYIFLVLIRKRLCMGSKLQPIIKKSNTKQNLNKL